MHERYSLETRETVHENTNPRGNFSQGNQSRRICPIMDSKSAIIHLKLFSNLFPRVGFLMGCLVFFIWPTFHLFKPLPEVLNWCQSVTLASAINNISQLISTLCNNKWSRIKTLEFQIQSRWTIDRLLPPNTSLGPTPLRLSVHLSVCLFVRPPARLPVYQPVHLTHSLNRLMQFIQQKQNVEVQRPMLWWQQSTEAHIL